MIKKFAITNRDLQEIKNLNISSQDIQDDHYDYSKVVVKKSKGFWRQDSPGCCWKISTSCKRNVSYKYELAFVDSATGYIKLYPMTSCAEVTTIAAKHLQWVANRRKKMQAKSDVAGNTTVVKQELLWNKGEYSVNLGCRIVGDSAMYFRSVDMNTIVNRFGPHAHTGPEGSGHISQRICC